MTFFGTLKSIARRTNPVLWPITMATGSISILFFAFPYGQGSPIMAAFSLAFFFLNIGLFVLFNAATVARLVMDPGHILRFLRKPSYSFFFSCYPIGATTLIVVSINVVYRYYGIGGKTFIYFLWMLWWINVAISALCLWGTTHWMITRHSHTVSGMTAAWILPIASFAVASSTGALTSQAVHEYSVHGALVTVTVSAYMLSSAVFLGSMIFTIYILRLVIHGFPEGLSVLSAFAPVGVSIQAGLAVSLVGAEYRDLLPLVSSKSLFLAMRTSGDAIHGFACIAAFIFWTWAVMWIVYAVFGVVHSLRRTKVEFKLSAWGLVFPNGGFANLTIHLAKVFDSGFFRVVGAIYTILTFLLYCYLSYNTLLMLPALFKPQAIEEETDEDQKTEKLDYYGEEKKHSGLALDHYSGSASFTIESGQLSQALKDEVTMVGWRLVV